MRWATGVGAGLCLVVAVALVGAGAPASARPADALRVTVDWGAGPASSWTLSCHPPGGTHPNARRACAALARMTDPFAVTPNTFMCTQIWSGPERARVVGVWAGRPVDRRFSRTDGCETARWDAYAALLTDPTVVPVAGTVDLGPTCPVQQVGQDCTTHGAPATITATRAGTTRRASSGASGFLLRLPRGVWSITADAGMSCDTVRVDLRRGRIPSPLVISCDTGIR